MGQPMEIIKKIVVTPTSIIELGNASCLTLGKEQGWFEYGRPGHPKGFTPSYNDVNNNERQAQIIKIGNAAELTLGHFGPTTEWGRPRWRR